MRARHHAPLVGLLAGLAIGASAVPPRQAPVDYQSLVRLHQDFAAFREPAVVHGVPDYTPAAMEAQRRGLDSFRRRLFAINPDTWSVPQRVDFARIDLRDLEQSDGVNLRREPLRATPPAGVIGWYHDLIARLRSRQPALVEPAEQALAAIERYRDWLRANESRMTAPAAIGQDNCNWYLRQVRLMSLDVKDLLSIGQRERDRALAFWRIEQHRNRGLPPIEPASTEAELARRVVESEATIRAFLREKRLLTIPDTVPAALRKAGPSISKKCCCRPGLLDGRPRSRELFYLLQLQRASRFSDLFLLVRRNAHEEPTRVVQRLPVASRHARCCHRRARDGVAAGPAAPHH